MRDDEYRGRRDRDLHEAREEIRFASKVGRSAGWRLGVVFLIVLGLSAVLGIGAWVFRVATSETKGKGDAQIQVNSAANRLQAQTRYTELYEGIQAADKKINGMQANARSEFDRTNVQGAINVCLENVAAYNRMATDVTTSKWRPELYPERLGDDPATDCQPTLPTPTASR